MRLLKRLTAFSMLLLPCCYVGAQTSTTTSMVVSEHEVVLGKVNLDSVSRISFTDEALSVDKKDGSNVLYSYHAAISFIEDDTNGVGKAETTKNNVRVYARENLIYIEGAEQGRVEVYALNGTQCVGLPQWQGQPVDVSALPKGVYVLKVGGASFKFRK